MTRVVIWESLASLALLEEVRRLRELGRLRLYISPDMVKDGWCRIITIPKYGTRYEILLSKAFSSATDALLEVPTFAAWLTAETGLHVSGIACVLDSALPPRKTPPGSDMTAAGATKRLLARTTKAFGAKLKAHLAAPIPLAVAVFIARRFGASLKLPFDIGALKTFRISPDLAASGSEVALAIAMVAVLFYRIIASSVDAEARYAEAADLLWLTSPSAGSGRLGAAQIMQQREEAVASSSYLGALLGLPLARMRRADPDVADEQIRLGEIEFSRRLHILDQVCRHDGNFGTLPFDPLGFCLQWYTLSELRRIAIRRVSEGRDTARVQDELSAIIRKRAARRKVIVQILVPISVLPAVALSAYFLSSSRSWASVVVATCVLASLIQPLRQFARWRRPWGIGWSELDSL